MPGQLLLLYNSHKDVKVLDTRMVYYKDIGGTKIWISNRVIGETNSGCSGLEGMER